MAETATILIPDISGYTEFVTRTEVQHGAEVTNHLIEAIVQSISADYVVSEIEGDAVLLYKKGSPPTKKELIDQCIKTFTAFHNTVRQMAADHLCQCGACEAIGGLTLKFVAHYGTIAEMSVAKFVKASGLDMIIAHRLLKNNINMHEYVLATNNYLDSISDSGDAIQLEWSVSEEEYPSIGTVKFHFASLASIKESLPPAEHVHRDAVPVDSSQVQQTELEINAPYTLIHECLLDMSKRREFVDGVIGGEGDSMLYMGAKHYCIFEEGKALIEPKHFEVKSDEIIYGEFATNPDANYYALYEFRIKAIDKNRSHLTWSVSPQPGHSFSEPVIEMVKRSLQTIPKKFKEICEKQFESYYDL